MTLAPPEDLLNKEPSEKRKEEENVIFSEPFIPKVTPGDTNIGTIGVEAP